MIVEILSPLREQETIEAKGILVPAEGGYFEVLDNHAPIFSKLVKGSIILTTDVNTSKQVAVNAKGGLIKVTKGKVVILLND